MTVLENNTPNGEVAAANEVPPAQPVAFTDQLPEDLRATLGTKFKDVGGMAKSYSELEKMLGADKSTLVKIPTERTPEAMREVYKALGAPDDPSGYELPIPEDTLFPKEAIDGLKGLLHSHGASPDLAKSLVEWYNEQTAGIVGQAGDQTELQKQTAQADLKQAWGMAYDTNIRLINAFVNKTTESEAEALALKQAIGNNPAALKWAAKQAEAAVPAKDLEMLLHGRPTSPDAARQRIAEIKAHPFYMDAAQINNPQRLAMIKELETLARVV